jgi:hypothetical protein
MCHLFEVDQRGDGFLSELQKETNWGAFST